MKELNKKIELKTSLHPLNKHREQYNFNALCKTLPELKQYVALNKFGNESIDFFNPDAIVSLNKALLKHFYNISYWEIPKNNLCPPIPGRADYICLVSDLIGNSKNDKINCLDIGVGANCIYPIIGATQFNWNFVGVDSDENALASAKQIIENNPVLKNKIELRLQKNNQQIFTTIIKPNEFFDVNICNPPFHSSAKEANLASQQKVSNLKGKTENKPVLNFGGKSNELWCKGGELQFVSIMITESKNFANSVKWFTTLISKASNLTKVYALLKSVNAKEVKTIEMQHGNKKSRIIAWTFIELKTKKP